MPDAPVTLDLTLPDMSCGHCVATVKKTVAALDAHAEVQIDLPSRRVQVQTRASADAVKAALADEGYPAA